MKGLKFVLPERPKPPRKKYMSVMFRVPAELRDDWQKLLESKKISGQEVVEAMVRFCMDDLKSRGEL